MNTPTRAPDGEGYFLYHSIGMYPDKALRTSAALVDLARVWGTPDDAQWPASFEIRQQFLQRWSSRIKAPRETITTAENVTTALSSLIGSLPSRYLRGKRVLVAGDCFPSMHFLLAGMAQRHEFQLQTVRLRPGETWVRDEDVIEQWGSDVGVALLTQVTSTASHRCDLELLVAHARKVGSLVGVDITQGVGIVPFDVPAAQVDFVVSTSLKWLCGTAGAGVLQVRGSLLQECAPELRGWFSQENPFSWDLDSFAYAGDSRRFDHGTPSIFPFAACIPALDWHASQSQSALIEHNRKLITAILDAAADLPVTLASPREANRRGGSIMLRLPDGADAHHTISALRAAGVFADCRGSTLRLSPGNLTTVDGVERCVRTIHTLLRA